MDEIKDFKSCKELKRFVVEKESLIPTASVKMKYFLGTDEELCEAANRFRPRRIPNNLITVVTIGGGNCLSHALANVLLSDQEYCDEVTEHITLVVVLNEDNFVTHQSQENAHVANQTGITAAPYIPEV